MVVFCALLLALSLVTTARGEDYPARHINVIIPAGAGAPPDTIMRLVAEPMSRVLGQQIVVENVPGSGGMTADRRAAGAPADGYNADGLLRHPCRCPCAHANLGFDPVESFEQVGLVAFTYVLLVGRKQLPANDLREFIAYLQANEKAVTEGHGGVGSISHVACTYLHALIKIEPTRVPFRATSDITVALLAGNIDYLCNQFSNIAEQIRAGQVKAFAVSADHRLPQLTDVPTAAEAGLPEFRVNAWFALQAPKGTPMAIVAKLNHALDSALDDPVVQARMEELGIEVAPKDKRSTEWLAPFITSEIAFWQPLLVGLRQR